MRLRGENIFKTLLLKIVYLVKEDTAMSFKCCGLFSLFVHCSRADYKPSILLLELSPIQFLCLFMINWYNVTIHTHFVLK